MYLELFAAVINSGYSNPSIWKPCGSLSEKPSGPINLVIPFSLAQSSTLVINSWKTSLSL